MADIEHCPQCWRTGAERDGCGCIIDLGAELAGFTDAEHAPAPRREMLARIERGESVPYVDFVQGMTITAPAAPPGYHEHFLPTSAPRCAQCRRYLPELDTPAAAGLTVAADCLYCEECADSRRRRGNDDPMPF